MDRTSLLSTPILRELVRRLADLDNRLATGILKLDSLIKSSRTLGALFGTDLHRDSENMPRLNKKLIEVIVKDCIRDEEARAKRPSPASIGIHGAGLERIGVIQDQEIFKDPKTTETKKS